MCSKLKLSIVVIFISVLFLSGCAWTRGTVDLSVPVSGESSKTNGKEVYINSVTDNRVFQVSPPEPNIPSLDPDKEQGDAIKHRAIARKRNSFGKGLGDILLPEGKTVESLINTTLRQVFIENGYTVLNNKEQVTEDTYLIDARINKLWSWMNLGFWAITLSTEISTDISIKNKYTANEKTVSIKVSDNFQISTGDNWIEVMQSGLQAYIREFKLSIIPIFQRSHSSSNTQSVETVRPAPMPVAQPQAIQQPAQPVVEDTIPSYEQTYQQPQAHTSGKDLRNCLALVDNALIAKCVRNAK
jgi:hypothetical protein